MTWQGKHDYMGRKEHNYADKDINKSGSKYEIEKKKAVGLNL